MSQPESVTDAFLPLVSQISEAEIPMFIAILERIAASNYRSWADSATDHVERDGLLACEAREIEIAAFIESIYPDPNATIAAITEKLPDLKALYGSVLAGRSRQEQLRIQSEAELGGADFMRQFAAANTGAIAARFISLAACEESNSHFLAALLDS
jgi:hypothetical protein